MGLKPATVVIPTLQPPLPEFLFPVKRTLSYTVDWRVFTAGTAVIQLEQDGTVQKINASGGSIGAVTMLFPVIDRFQAGFDTKTGCSTGFNKQLQEGRRKVSSELNFDYAQGKQKQVERNLVKGTSKEQTASIPACVTDSLSAMFYAASQPMVVGQTIKFPPRRLDAHGDCDHEGRGQGRDQDPGRNLSDDPRRADRRRGRRQEPGQYLDLVHGRCTTHPGTDSRASVLGNHYGSAAVLRGKVREEGRMPEDSMVDPELVDPDKFVTVGKFLEPANAQMAKGLLESAGIECFLQGENANSLLALAFVRVCWCINTMRQQRGSCSAVQPMS